MSLLNINLGVLAYSDGPASNQPKMRLADLAWSMQGLPTGQFRNTPISLAPGETMTVATTVRPITLTSETEVTITSIDGDRMIVTGNFGQRTARATGDQSTVWEITKSGSVVRLSVKSGAAANFAQVQVGDILNVSQGFCVQNQGEFLILSKGSNYVEYINAYAQEETDISGEPVSIYSSGPVQKGDIIDLTSQSLAFPNQGSFPVTAVTDKYIEVINPQAFPQTVSGFSSGMCVYPFAYKWVMVAVDHKVLVGLNGNAPGSIEVEPQVENDLVRNPGIFLKRGKVFELQIMNPGLKPVSGFVLLAE